MKDIGIQVRRLEEQVERLTAKVTVLEEMFAKTGAESAAGLGRTLPADQELQPIIPAKDDFWLWLNQQALLAKIATACFILVFALILRVVSDKGIISPMMGSIAGMGYASLLVLWGAMLYGKSHKLASVFPVLGLLLLYSITYESQGRFETFSTQLAYIFLYCALGATAVIGLKHRAVPVLHVGILGAAVTAVITHFPYPVFPLAVGVLLTAEIISLQVVKKKICPSLPWSVLAVTTLFWLLWAYKLYVPLNRGSIPAAALYAQWYLPAITGFLVVFTWQSWRILTTVSEPPLFIRMLPTFSVVFLFATARIVTCQWPSFQFWLAMAILVLTIYHCFVAVGWVRKKRVPRGVIPFALAAAAGLLIAIPEFTGNIFWALPLWTASAYGLARLSGRWRQDSLRLLSYILQGCILGIALAAGAFSESQYPAAGLTGTVFLAVFGLLHYLWARTNPPAGSILFFSRLDRRDGAATILLVIGLAGIYGAGSQVLFLTLPPDSSGATAALQCFQTVLLNIMAASLLVIGSRKPVQKDILYIGIGLACLGGLKTFIVDFFRAQGIPMVLSVLSFGGVATIGSFLSGHRHKIDPEPGEQN